MDGRSMDKNGPNIADFHADGDGTGAVDAALLAEFNQQLSRYGGQELSSKGCIKFLKRIGLAAPGWFADFGHVMEMQADKVAKHGVAIYPWRVNSTTGINGPFGGNGPAFGVAVQAEGAGGQDALTPNQCSP